MLSSTSYATNAPGLALLDAVALVQGHVARFADVKAHVLEGRRAHGGVHNVGEAVAHLRGRALEERQQRCVSNDECVQGRLERVSIE